VALHQGWIEGKERIITCVSGEFAWLGGEKPAVHLFDLEGRENTQNVAVTRSPKGWKADMPLRNWAGIAVLKAQE